MYVCVCVLFFFISGSCGGEEKATKKKKESSFLVCIFRPINSTICCGCLFFFPYSAVWRRFSCLMMYFCRCYTVFMLLCCILFSSTLPSSVSPLLFNHLSGVKTTETTVKNKQIEISERKKKKNVCHGWPATPVSVFFFCSLFVYAKPSSRYYTACMCVCLCAWGVNSGSRCTLFFFASISLLLLLYACFALTETPKYSDSASSFVCCLSLFFT